jgi:hypothetical protein
VPRRLPGWEPVRRWFGNSPGRWVPAGLVGGAAGAFAVAWLLWGSARQFWNAICFPMNVLGLVVLYLVAAVGAYSFIATLQHMVRAIRHLRRPSIYAYYEPPSEQFPELEIIAGRYRGCGLLILVPILLLTLAVSLPWFLLAPSSVPPDQLLLAVLLGLPPGVIIARQEARREAKRGQG